MVVYSYTLSPFCTDAKAILDSAGARFKTIELGAEWIPGLLPGRKIAPLATLQPPPSTCSEIITLSLFTPPHR